MVAARAWSGHGPEQAHGWPPVDADGPAGLSGAGRSVRRAVYSPAGNTSCMCVCVFQAAPLFERGVRIGRSDTETETGAEMVIVVQLDSDHVSVEVRAWPGHVAIVHDVRTGRLDRRLRTTARPKRRGR